MPIYEYLCEDCGHSSEELQKMGARPLRKCPACGGKYSKQISASAFQFKGTGWYVTDYAKKDGGSQDDTKEESSKSAKDDSAKAKTKKDKAKSDSPTKRQGSDSGKKPDKKT